MNESVYLTAAEVAAMLRITIRTLYTHVRDKRIPAPIWLGSKRLWPAQAIHDHVCSPRNQRKR